jgi:hypothetical protein
MTTNRMYIMPGPQGGQELEPIRLDDGGWDFFKWPLGSNLSAELRLPARLATPALPEEPPYGTVVRALITNEDEPWVFERLSMTNRTDGKNWGAAGRDEAYGWADLNVRGTPVRLVPDPFAEPVELPWERKVTPYVFIATDGGTGYLGLTIGPSEVTSHGYSLDVDEARDMARALMAAADAAEKEQS